MILVSCEDETFLSDAGRNQHRRSIGQLELATPKGSRGIRQRMRSGRRTGHPHSLRFWDTTTRRPDRRGPYWTVQKAAAKRCRQCYVGMISRDNVSTTIPQHQRVISSLYGSRPCAASSAKSLVVERIASFHGSNTGSNSVGDGKTCLITSADSIKHHVAST